jgi:hypothetical protein
MDVVLVGLLATLPILAWSIYLVARRRDYASHRKLQLLIAAALLAAIVVFEVDIRLISDWKLRAAPSPFWPAGVLTALGIHLVFAVSTPVLWTWVVWEAWRRFPSPPQPNSHSSRHRLMARLAAGRPTDIMRRVAPEAELRRMTRNARRFLALYVALAAAILAGWTAPLWLWALPRLLGAPAMLLFTTLQHVELQENSPSIIESTRSFRAGWLSRWLYLNMNNHVEHHLYPQAPFFALPALRRALASQLPPPDPAFWPATLDVLWVTLRRSLGRDTRAWSIRQAPHMIASGQFHRVARRTM